MPAAVSSSDTVAPAFDPLMGLPYRAVELLGAGGMGEVFLAEHRELGSLCVVKILHARFAGDERLADRVRLEAQALGRLRNPFIVSVSGAGTTFDGRPFIVMEYLEGHTVAEELALRGHLPPREALKYTCELLQGLEAAHARGIVHRDIKPANLFLCDEPGGVRRLKVVDFGLTRIMPDAPQGAPQPLAVPTDTGVIIGTPRYVSPEGAREEPIDHRGDVYGAALVLYLMVAGRGPFDHIRSERMVLSAHAAEKPQAPSHFAKQPIPPELDRVILFALRKNPTERFQSAAEFREQLEQIRAHVEDSPLLLETNEYDAAWFAGAAHSASSGSLESLPNERPVSLDDEPSNHRSPLALPDDPALRKDVSPSLQARIRPAVTNLHAAVIFLSALVIAAIVTVGLIALVREGTMARASGAVKASSNAAPE